MRVFLLFLASGLLFAGTVFAEKSDGDNKGDDFGSSTLPPEVATELNDDKDIDIGGGKGSGGSIRREYNDKAMEYVASNVVATLFHEVAHALIDNLNLPVFAREEDAADTFVVVLTDYLFPPSRAEHITWASADQYARDQREAEKRGHEPAVWDVHSLDLVRYYNLICLYYGGNPYQRDDFAADNGLPEDRAETCEDERDLADKSWGRVISDIVADGSDEEWLIIDEATVDESANPYVAEAHNVIRTEVARLNRRFSPGFTIEVQLIDCEEVNAFYDPNDRVIIMCNELTRAYIHEQ